MRVTARRVRAVVAVTASLVVLAPLGWFWTASLVPGSYSVMDAAALDSGGGPLAHAHRGAAVEAGGTAGTPVASLTGPTGREPDVRTTLVARSEPVDVGGAVVDGYTLERSSPGPELRVRHGDLLEVTLVNESVDAGATLHWHGVDVPNAEDGTAGITQDAVPVGGEHVYRFVAEDAGTYWYHSHQVSSEQVARGLWGVLVVEPADAAGAPDGAGPVDVVAAVHTYGGHRTVAGSTGSLRVDAAPGTTARVRVVNTDAGALRAWTTAPYRVLAVDGTDLVGPTPVDGAAVVVTAGARADLEVRVPTDGTAVRIDLGGGDEAVVVGPPGAPLPAAVPPPVEVLDLLGYGSPATGDGAPRAEALALLRDEGAVDRRFAYRIGREAGFHDGRPGFWWTVNGQRYPEVPAFEVAEGDVVRMTITNDSGESHPMHLHGHHVLVLSRDGVPSTGSPWWADSLDVRDGETWEVALLADNPGIWSDHCHNLPHAAQGLVAHLAYAGVVTPTRIGGTAGNTPE